MWTVDRPPDAYVRREYSPCAGCVARGQATDGQMALSWSYRARFRPARVRLLLIAESPPQTLAGRPLRHFYNPAAPAPDTLFRATAPVLLGDRSEGHVASWTPSAKEAALERLASRGFFMLDSAQCPVNHLPGTAARREVARRCAAVVLREQMTSLPITSTARICLVLRGTVPQAVLPVLAELGLVDRVTMLEGLPFPGRWPGHREAFQRGLAAAAGEAGWE